MTRAEEEFVKAQGDKWAKAMAVAAVHIRQDRRFVGLEKIREPAILEATFAAFDRPMANPPLARMFERAEAPLGLLAEIDKLIVAAAAEAKKAIA